MENTAIWTVGPQRETIQRLSRGPPCREPGYTQLRVYSILPNFTPCTTMSPTSKGSRRRDPAGSLAIDGASSVVSHCRYYVACIIALHGPWSRAAVPTYVRIALVVCMPCQNPPKEYSSPLPFPLPPLRLSPVRGRRRRRSAGNTKTSHVSIKGQFFPSCKNCLEELHAPKGQKAPRSSRVTRPRASHHDRFAWGEDHSVWVGRLRWAMDPVMGAG